MTAGIEVGTDFLVLALGPLLLGGERPVEMTAEKPQRLLAALALQPNRWVSTGELTEALWPEGAPASARGNLKTYVHLLRQLLPATGEQQRIDSRQGGYRLVVDRDELDVTAFEDLVGQAREALADGDPATAAAVADAALRLWRGEPFESLSGSEAEIERVRLSELRRAAADCKADALLAQGRADEVIALLRPLATADSLREATWERLMQALVQAGRPAEALRTYHELRTGLATELGTEPGPGPRRLYMQLLAADRQAGGVPPAEPLVPVPPKPPFWRRRWKVLLTAAVVVVLVAAGSVTVIRWVTAVPPPQVDAGITAIVTSKTPIQRRPVPVPPPGHLVFGIGDGVDTVLAMPFYQQNQASFGMVTQFYNGPDGRTQLSAWHNRAVPRIYASGKAIHLRYSVGYSDHAHDFIGPDGVTPMCGLSYLMSNGFLLDVKAVALAFGGKATDPPLYVSMFNGVDKSVCEEGYLLSAANAAYFQELKVRYLQAVRLFHYYAPNARVGVDVDGWLNEGGDLSGGRNATMLHYLEDVFKQSDFQSFALFQGPEGNVYAVQTMLPYLSRFGPVMVSRFAPFDHLDVFDSDSAQLLNAVTIRQLTAQRLFAWSYEDDAMLGSSPKRTQFARNVTQQFGAPPQ